MDLVERTLQLLPMVLNFYSITVNLLNPPNARIPFNRACKMNLFQNPVGFDRLSLFKVAIPIVTRYITPCFYQEFEYNANNSLCNKK
jgi:hypothetical protein